MEWEDEVILVDDGVEAWIYVGGDGDGDVGVEEKVGLVLVVKKFRLSVCRYFWKMASIDWIGEEKIIKLS